MMEYQKIINLLDNAPNQPSKFITKNCVEINHDARRMYNANIQIKFKSSTLKSIYVIIVIHIYLLVEL